MSGFRSAPGGGARIRLHPQEAAFLADLARQVATLIADRTDAHDDPVLERLLPDAYLDAPEDAAEFRRFTEDELGDAKVRNAMTVLESVTAEPGAKRVDIVLDAAGVGAWLRSLTDIRLALAIRLEITEEGAPPDLDEPDRINYAIYNWLGTLQGSLVAAIDRR
ncbi:DUF2017 family protein [Galbitalea soli]|uniref:DUF2017 domain-containing protein n=1 Tax=Galbitalea soli TaxID=1268042 RepID=A0A7C9PNF1_9MICO|nr:DUF2017 domain-containing protein [Galbitalea soli]NYJ30349.1 hypothetical protein [Galbitalea soli]